MDILITKDKELDDLVDEMLGDMSLTDPLQAKLLRDFFQAVEETFSEGSVVDTDQFEKLWHAAVVKNTN